MESAPALSEYEQAMQAWRGRAPWYRRMLGRAGLQGKLLLSFMGILTVALGGSCWLFISQGSARLADMTAEHARQMAHALALAGRPALEMGQDAELRRIGQDLIKSRNIVFVVFLDANGHPVASVSRDQDFQWRRESPLAREPQGRPGLALELMRVRPGRSPVLGEYVEVAAPILSLPSPLRPLHDEVLPVGSRVLGHVAVGMSQSREQVQLRKITALVFAGGLLMVLICLPMTWAFVHRIFQPIRELVRAADRIAAGHLETEVAFERPDVIGMLARSFNEMVKRVRRHREELAAANAKLALANRDLEQKVRQRTAELETANRRLSSEIAEKEEFLRAVSHDLNAPLRNISGMASMLLLKHRERLDEEIVHRLERIQKNVEAETGLIGELLELSRIKTRRQRIERVDVNALLQELAGMFENDLNTRRINLIIEHGLPVLVSERLRIRQVFLNLIDNGIKYMGPVNESLPRRREIRVGCRMIEGEAEFQVSDTGSGIPAEDLPRIFHVFRRGRGAAVRGVAGRGVGLASVKSIIETYHGRIWAESTVDQGSVFRFTISARFVPALDAGAEQLVQESGVCPV